MTGDDLMRTRIGRAMRRALVFVADHPGTSLTAAAQAAHKGGQASKGRTAVQACQQTGLLRDAAADLAGPRSLYITGEGLAILGRPRPDYSNADGGR